MQSCRLASSLPPAKREEQREGRIQGPIRYQAEADDATSMLKNNFYAMWHWKLTTITPL